jgi:hypothetical protein
LLINNERRLYFEKGTRPRAVRQQQFEYGYIFGAVCPAKDKALGLMLPVANTAGMTEHLRLISLHLQYLELLKCRVTKCISI